MLNSRQIAAERLLISILQRSGAFKPSDGIIIKLTACTYVEMLKLQEYCNERGTTYEVMNNSGDLYSKHRPEHQQLTEARSKLMQLLKELGATPAARKKVESEPQVIDPLLELLNMK
tara:strand:- start:4077 stop:4427 length:351 start_codon:yes stop_codon:yes gene_type:complete